MATSARLTALASVSVAAGLALLTPVGEGSGIVEGALYRAIGPLQGNWLLQHRSQPLQVQRVTA